MKPAPAWLVWWGVGMAFLAPHMPWAGAVVLSAVCVVVSSALYWGRK